MKNAILMGATGATGSALLDLLIKSPLYNEIHIVHYKNTGLTQSPKVIEHIIQMDRLSDQLNISSDIHDVFCTIGTTRKKAKSIENFIKIDLLYVLDLAQWSKSKGVNSFNIVSSIGANKKSWYLYLKTKGQMENSLKDINFPNLTIFRPPLLYAPERKEKRMMEVFSFEILSFLSTLFPKLMQNQRPLHVEKLAKNMLAFAQEKKEPIRILEARELQ